jgi:prepilin-type N-terminal cleavage/methylation domain-containing protein
MRLSKRSAFTLMELLTVVGIIAVLASLVAVVLARVRESGRQSVCLKNLTTISAAIHLYAAEHDGRFPIFKDFDVPLAPYVREPRIFECRLRWPSMPASILAKHRRTNSAIFCH